MIKCTKKILFCFNKYIAVFIFVFRTFPSLALLISNGFLKDSISFCVSIPNRNVRKV